MADSDLENLEIIEVELTRVRVPMVSVHRSASAVQADRESIVVSLRSSAGTQGVAECPTLATPGYVTETTDEAWSVLRSELVPRWIAGSRMAAPGAPAASGAMADALLDASLRSRGLPLVDHLSAPVRVDHAPRRAVEWCAVLADVRVGPPAAVSWANEALDAGAALLKFKFDDPARLRALVEAVRDDRAGPAPELPLAADANGSMAGSDLAVIDDLALTYLEQPLPVGTPWDALNELRSMVVTPIALDESLPSPDALNDAINAGAIDVASIKPARMGGIMAAATAVRVCAERGIDCFVGGMFELGVGRAGALGVAAMRDCTLPTDLGPSHRYFRQDISDPLRTDAAGRMLVPTGAGIGRVVEGGALEKFVVERLHYPPSARTVDRPEV